MSVVRQTIRVVAWALLSMVVGCDDDEGTPARVTHCRSVCDSLDMCVAETDLTECYARCDDQKFRSDLYYELKAQCVSDRSLSCNEWDHELDRRGEDVCRGDNCKLAECVRNRLRRTEVSPAQKDKCDSQANKLEACFGVDARELSRECQLRALELSQEYLADTERCVNGKCGDLKHCIEDLKFEYGTKLSVFDLP
jgi:hypothetical protein